MLAFASLKADYMSIQDRENTMRSTHAAIMQKWEPALNNLSSDSLTAIVKKIKTALKEKEASPFYNADAPETKSRIRDLEALPFTFACEELDRDIAKLSAHRDQVRMSNRDSTLDISRLQELRVQMDGLACVQHEQQQHASFVKRYAACMIGLGIGCTTYVWYQPWQLKA
jgi:hypothetical protein